MILSQLQHQLDGQVRPSMSLSLQRLSNSEVLAFERLQATTGDMAFYSQSPRVGRTATSVLPCNLGSPEDWKKYSESPHSAYICCFIFRNLVQPHHHVQITRPHLSDGSIVGLLVAVKDYLLPITPDCRTSRAIQSSVVGPCC